MTFRDDELDAFLTAYINCAFWSSTDADGNPLDDWHEIADLTAEARERMERDCRAFLNRYTAIIRRAWPGIPAPFRRAGHDFWLNRNGHGSGFWDGDWPEVEGTILDEASRAAGPADLYVGDDGKVHHG